MFPPSASAERRRDEVASTPWCRLRTLTAEHRGTVHGLWAPLAEQARVAGATACGDPAGTRELSRLLRSGEPVPDALLAPPGAGGPERELDPDALVCSCNAVSHRRLTEAIGAGALSTVADVARATRATTRCGRARATWSACSPLRRRSATRSWFTERKHGRDRRETALVHHRPRGAAGLAIVGGGIAGQALSEALRERDAEVPITLFCGEERLPYDRVRLSQILVSGEDPGALELRPPEWYADRRMEVRMGCTATALEPETWTIELGDGEARAFAGVAVCTGSQPLMPPIAGLDKAGVIPFRGPGHCDRLRYVALSAIRGASSKGR